MAVRVGLIGAGNIGREHIRNLALLPDVAELVAVADNHEPSRQETCELLEQQGMRSAVVVENFEELLHMNNVDALIICTPNFHHIEVLRKASQSGKALMIEKPLCTTIADCLEAAELSRASGQPWWVGMEYRYIPSIERLINEVVRGRIGRLRMLAIREHRFPFLTKVGHWNRFNEKTGGTLVEKCCHFFDLMIHIIESPPIRVFASGAQDVNHTDEEYDGMRPDILDNAYVVVDFANGARACLDLCMFAEASKNQEEIIAIGDLGKLEAFAPSHGTAHDNLDRPNLLIGTRGEVANCRDPPPPKVVQEFHVPIDPVLMAAGHHCGATYTELREFFDALKSGREPTVTVADGLRAVALGIAAQRSIAERRVIELAELGLGVFFDAVVHADSQGTNLDGIKSQHSKSVPSALDKNGFGLAFYPNRARAFTVG